MCRGHVSRAQEHSQPYKQGGRQTMGSAAAPLDEANGLTNNATGLLFKGKKNTQSVSEVEQPPGHALEP